MSDVSDVPVIGWWQEFIGGNSKKFYAISVTDTGVLAITWGRIGTAGQSKIQSFPTRLEAETVGKRQLYAKAAKGYVTKHNEVPFLLLSDKIDRACTSGDGHVFQKALLEAANNPEFINRKAAVFRHYDDFNAAAQRLMERISGGEFTFDEMQIDFAALEESWRELDERHDTAKVSIQLAGQMLAQGMMTGTLK